VNERKKGKRKKKRGRGKKQKGIPIIKKRKKYK
jgi:hypothetical protein